MKEKSARDHRCYREDILKIFIPVNKEKDQDISVQNPKPSQKISIQQNPDLFKLIKRPLNRFNKIKEIIYCFKITGVMDSAYSLMFI